MMKRLQYMLILLVPCAFAHAASFNCAKATTLVEKAICGNATLSTLDEALSDNYRQMYAANIGDGARKHLKSSQKAWLIKRNGCKTSGCIESLYRKRIDEVCEIPVLRGVHPLCTYSNEIK